MNLQSDWARIKNDVRKRWSDLSDADVARVNGDSDTLCSVIEQRYHISHEDADRQVQDFLGKEGISSDGNAGRASSSGSSRNQASGAGTRPESGSGSGNVWESPSRVPSGSQSSGGNPGVRDGSPGGRSSGTSDPGRSSQSAPARSGSSSGGSSSGGSSSIGGSSSGGSSSGGSSSGGSSGGRPKKSGGSE